MVEAVEVAGGKDHRPAMTISARRLSRNWVSNVAEKADASGEALYEEMFAKLK